MSILQRAAAASVLFASISAPVFGSTTVVPGTGNVAIIHRDVDGIVHIIAKSEAELLFAQGYAHARDRFFQMDALRRQSSGTLGELLGESVIDDDVLLRTLGLRRAAERSLAVLSAASLDGLAAYANGVNFYLQNNPLPPEYGPLEITDVAPWTPLDSVTAAKALAFNLSFDLDVDLTTRLVEYQTVGANAGFDGSALFFEDVFRSAPFDNASTVPDASNAVSPFAPLGTKNDATDWRHFDSSYLRPVTLAGASRFMQKLRTSRLPGLATNRREEITGSNEWGVSGRKTATGRPLIANDPHLSLGTPATFYQNHLYAPSAGYDVIGSSFTGVPLVVLGQNRYITWGATTNPMDVTDTFQETLVPSPDSDFGLGVLTDGEVSPIDLLPITFRVNVIGDGIDDNLSNIGGLDIPPFVLTVPRRNDGPIVSLDVGNLSAVSIQFTGFGPTREVETFRKWNLAKNLDDFIDGVQDFDFGSQNWAYADIEGNLAYFSSAEMPIREDLQAGIVNGLPPFFIRDGSGGNEWLPVANPQPNQALPYEILRFDEMPQVVNPPTGYFVNANNDPAGTTLDNDPLNQRRAGGGIYYLNPGYAIGTRAGRITSALRARLERGRVTRADMEAIQADVRLLDAEVFVPLIISAYKAAREPGAVDALATFAGDDALGEAATRLARWKYSTPTGVAEGYDARDKDGVLTTPDSAEIEASINATIYSVWRSQFIANTIDRTLASYGLGRPGSGQTMTALRNLIDNFTSNGGVGASGLDFFAVSGVADADTRLAIIALQSLADALELLGGANFAAAFGGSTNQDDYRWGRLHRIVLEHPLGEPFSIPPAGGSSPPSFGDLEGFAVDGGFGVVDASSHSVRAASAEAFRYGSGPVRRYVGQPGTKPGSIAGQTILPGGSSGILGSPWYDNLLGRWLTNDTYPMRQKFADIKPLVVETTLLKP